MPQQILFEDTSKICNEAYQDATGTWCCIQRNSRPDANNAFQYEYHSNLTGNLTYEWIVTGGIEIVSGANSKIVTVRFTEDFSSATLIGIAHETLIFPPGATGIGCSELVEIIKL